jgi:uncharacterized protein
MNPRLLRPLAFVAIVLLLPCCLAHALEVPPLRARVNDLAGLLAHREAIALEDKLSQFEQQTGHQIVVLAIPSLEGDDIASFALKAAEYWKLGQKGHDNWVLLLVATNDRKLRIEVGYGLEGTVPDVIAHRIIDEIIVPRFREKDFAGGIDSGLSAIMQATQGEQVSVPGRGQSWSAGTSVSGILALFCMAALLGLFVGLTRSSAVRGALSGAIASGLMGLIGIMATGLGIWLLAVLIGALSGMVASMFARRAWGRAWSVRAPRQFDYSPRDTFYTGYGGGSSGDYGAGGSAGGSGGGFAGGGGGGGGGGGASGGW